MTGQFVGGPCDGEALPLFADPSVPWICAAKPKVEAREHLYLPDGSGDYRYAGPCRGVGHDHYDIHGLPLRRRSWWWRLMSGQ